MNYPPSPWSLNGFAYQTFQLASIDEARRHVPKELSIIPILPGRTASGIYIAKYEDNSDLSYSELILIDALVRYKYYVGFWCSHIFVDHPLSVLGGRKIWKLPKKLADFNWNVNIGSMKDDINLLKVIINNDDIFFNCNYQSKLGIKLKFTIPLITYNQSKIFFSKMKISSRIYFSKMDIFWGDAKIKKNLKVNESNISGCFYENLNIQALAPKIIEL